MKRNQLIKYVALALFSTQVLALPIDWTGSFTFDANRIDKYKRVDGAVVNGNGSYGVVDNGIGGENAIFQSYILKLNPHIIVNDAVSVKGVLSTGRQQGEQLGNNSVVSSDNRAGGLHYNASAAGNSSLDISQLYAELYADTALYRFGRFTKHWGMGAVINGGKDPQDRFFTLYDGIEAEYNFGKFFITPYWAKLNTGSSFTRDTQVSELGAHFLYDNPDKDMKFGVLYTKRSSGGNNSLLVAADPDNAGTTHNIGQSDYKLIDVYFEKTIGSFNIALEIPSVSGTAGNIYDSNTRSSYKSQATLLNFKYDSSAKWDFGILAGTVSGDDATNTEFSAMYLHPNFQVARLMFMYNLNAIQNATNANVYESYITNATIAKLYAHYTSDKWSWKFAYVMAKANETAKNGKSFYQHERRYKVTTANGDQSDDLGSEFDISFDYQWNPNVTLSGYLGYYLVGDFYGFTNTGTDQEVDNSYTSGLSLSVTF